MRRLSEIKILNDTDKKWAISELNKFKKTIKAQPVDDETCYSRSFNDIYKVWYNRLHDGLRENGFANGEPEKNSFNKNPKAMFWWCIYCTNPHHYKPYYDHHCSSTEVRVQMLNIINDAIDILSD